MFSKIFNKLKSILGKESLPKTTKSKKVNKPTKASKSNKSTKSTKAPKSKKQEMKIICESFTKLPGIGVKSAKAFYDAGFKSTNEIITANDDQLLAVPGVGVNLVKKLREHKSS